MTGTGERFEDNVTNSETEWRTERRGGLTEGQE